MLDDLDHVVLGANPVGSLPLTDAHLADQRVTLGKGLLTGIDPGQKIDI